MLKYKILVLGSKGLLGNTVFEYLSSYFSITQAKGRWPDATFKKSIISFEGDLIINCIGAIPQKVNSKTLFFDLNFNLPKWLDENAPSNCKIIHPTTDCEFKGDIPLNQFYKFDSIQDAEDDYGISKYSFTKWCLANSNRTKIIRTSIIGLEKTSNYSLLSWFLSQENKANGYLNHHWNGVTTLEWSKWALKVFSNWDYMENLVQLGTDPISKFELLELINSIWEKEIVISPVITETYSNKLLRSQFQVKSLEFQLNELRNWG